MTQAIKAARESVTYWIETRKNWETLSGIGRAECHQAALDVMTGHSVTIHALLTAAEKVDFEALGRAISVVSYMTDEHDTHEQVLLKAATALHEAMKG